jgi:hypothetical protein
VDKESRYRSTVNVLTRPGAGEGLELIGHHELIIPLLHAALAAHLATAAGPRAEGPPAAKAA